jgi:hypothetical protein
MSKTLKASRAAPKPARFDRSYGTANEAVTRRVRTILHLQCVCWTIGTSRHIAGVAQLIDQPVQLLAG